MEAAGLAIGLIPLGYKIYTEVDEYIESTRNADSETASLLALLRRGRNLLQLFALIVNRNGPIQDRMEDLVAETCADLQKDLDSASKIVKKLRGEKDVEKAERAATFPQGLQGLSKKKKFTYHFRRESLRKLEEHLTHANTHLSLVLQMYSLVVSSVAHAETNSLLGDIKTDIQSLTTVETKSRILFEDDATSQQDTASATPAAVVDDDSLLCHCRAKSLVKRSTTGSPWLSLSRERKTIIVHDPSCVYHKLEEARSERSFTITIGGRTFWSQLSTAVAISINLPSSRFGQWSICPQMRTYNIINFEESPAIRLFDFADELEDLEWDDPSMEKKARAYWHGRIIEVFRTGKSSPFDVDGITNRPILHYLRFTSRKSGRPYEQLIWETLQKLDFPEHMQQCNGLEPWAYNFSRSHPLLSGRLEPDLLPWNVDRWLEPTEIPEELLQGNSPAYGKLGRAFVLTIIMNQRRSLLESSNVGPLCQAIIMRCGSKALGILDDNISSWNEPFMGDESSICAIDLAIMWFPELMNALLEENKASDSRLNRLRLPRPHPSQHSFFEPALAFGLMHGEKVGKATTQDYLAMVSLALERDYPIYFKPISPYLGLAAEDVTEHLADRRRRLLELARRRLDQSAVDLSKGPDKVLADEQLEEILQAFKDQGITLPEALLPRNLNDEKPLAGSVFEYATHSEDLSDRLQQVGFDPEGFVRSRCRDGPSPIPPTEMCCKRWNCWEYLWLEDIVSTSQTLIGQTPISCPHDGFRQFEGPHCNRSKDKHTNSGAIIESCSQRLLSAPTFLHSMMMFVGRCMPRTLFSLGCELPSPDISPFVKTHLLSTNTDNCVCGCSANGCTPFQVFLDGMSYSSNSAINFDLDRVTTCFRVVQIVLDTEKISSTVAMEVFRSFSFQYLNCRHTCCKFAMSRYILRRSQQWPCHEIDVEEREEIRDEDSEKLMLLEEFMKDLQSTMEEKDWDILELVQTWWAPRMQKSFQGHSEKQLSQDDIERIRNVGVNLEVESSRIEVVEEDEDAGGSGIEVRFDRLETDEERLRAVQTLVDRMAG